MERDTKRIERDAEARRPLDEAGQGEAEGFEQAEERLRDLAEHRDEGGNPRHDRGEPEEADPRATYGEADHEHSSAGESDR
jgi:hypothetical protein